MQTHILGYPRIGKQRELKFLLEQFWQGDFTEQAFLAECRSLRAIHWQQQLDNGIDILTVGDFAHYDHVLNTSLLFGVIPDRIPQQLSLLAKEFAIARGLSQHNCCQTHASDMTKWFNTNYHYLVPEFNAETRFTLNADALLDQIEEAKQFNVPLKVTLLGPVSYLYLGKGQEQKTNKLSLLPELLNQYQALLNLLETQAIDYLVLEEPVLSLELTTEWQQALINGYQQLHINHAKLLVANYFGETSHQLETIRQFHIDGFHFDVLNESRPLLQFITELPAQWLLSLGIIDGRNVFKADLVNLYQTLNSLPEVVKQRSLLASSCSLLHCPVDLSAEQKLDKELSSWLAFAIQKCQELALLKKALQSQSTAKITQYSAPAIARLVSTRVKNEAVQQAVATINCGHIHRQSDYAVRKKQQQQRLQLPLLPTTTIGSFPQTAEVRQTRSQYKRGVISEQTYNARIKQQIAFAIEQQQQLGLDVLVHGEAERNDMVEYFAQYLAGCCTTEFGWVQSYGSRCVKPAIFYGDISRKQPITLDWINYAQSLTDKPVKAMLTGPMTIYAWSFIRDDIPAQQVCQQLALAIGQEVNDLVEAQHQIIQIDEPAIREKLPLKQSHWAHYLAWATECFRLTHYQVADDVQIHSHLCYSEFEHILAAIKALDVDVLTVETSRSNMDILQHFIEQDYHQDLGPGVYDIHSPNVPTVDWIAQLIKQALQHFSPEQLWLNPDCGLKTRQWPETLAALKNMVTAAKQLRTELAE